MRRGGRLRRGRGRAVWSFWLLLANTRERKAISAPFFDYRPIVCGSQVRRDATVGGGLGA